MRIWYGVDVEHNLSYGYITLFVESENPDIDKILGILINNNLGIESIYFGAGEVDVKNWDFLNRLREISNTFIVGIETSTPLPQSVINQFDFVIFRLPIPCVSDKIYFKYRTENEVGISSILNFSTNSLTDLKDGQYSNDVELYSED